MPGYHTALDVRVYLSVRTLHRATTCIGLPTRLSIALEM